MGPQPLIPNGIYKIRNGEYEDFVTELYRGIPRGPIVAITERPYNRHDKWRLRNVGDGGNQVTLENMSRPGTYANPEGGGSSIIGSDNRTIWTIVKVDGGMYCLQSPEADCVWELPMGVDYENILLVPHTGQLNTKWMFQRVYRD